VLVIVIGLSILARSSVLALVLGHLNKGNYRGAHFALC